ncbi:MAG: protein translocase subunit SecD [Phycisphaerales bacterium]|nr:protein translocase subunit SecD [Phycisphaerales bacterium]
MDKNITQRLLIILAAIVLGAIFLTPPSQQLKPGLDIAGGVSMIFEINDAGMENHPNLAEEVKVLLQRRVDPKGVYNLTWRVHGRNRLEIQMPLSPPDAAKRKQVYQDAQDALFLSKLQRTQIERAAALPPDQREAEIAKLAQGAPARDALVRKAVAAVEELSAAEAAAKAGPAAIDPATSAPATQPTQADLNRRLRNARENIEDAIDAALATNLDPARFKRMLEMDPSAKAAARAEERKQLETAHPELKEKIDAAVKAYDEWATFRTFLDGPDELRRLLKGAGVLEFRILAEPSPSNPTQYDTYREHLKKNGAQPAPGHSFVWFRIDDPMNFFDIDSPAAIRNLDPRGIPWCIAERLGDDMYVLGERGEKMGLTAKSTKKWRLKGAIPSRDQHGRPNVVFELDVVGGGMFRELTSANIGRHLCITLDDVAYTAPVIKGEIGSSGTIEGDFSPEKVNYLVRSMQAGALPARLKDTPISERVLGSSLGEANLRSALRAGYIAALLVLGIMAVYYGLCGLVANVAMIMNVFLTLAAMAFLDARFTLDGIAGIILSIGMAVDANVLLYERMREEKDRGASLRTIIKNGYDKAVVTILDSNITTLLTCLIIYYVGSEEVKGFGLTLGWGVVLNIFTAVFVTRTMFLVGLKYGWLKDIKMMKAIGIPNIDWFKLRRFFIPASITGIAACFLLLGLVRRPADYLDVEFLGGISADLELKADAVGKVDDRQIAAKLDEVGKSLGADAGKLSEVTIEAIAGDPTGFVVKVPGVDAARIEAMVREPLEEANLLARDGVVSHAGEQQITVHTGETISPDALRDRIRGFAAVNQQAGKDLQNVNVASVIEAGGEKGRIWSVTTTVTNKRLVQHAITEALGTQLRTQPKIAYAVQTDNGHPFPITDRRLDRVVPAGILPQGAGAELTDFLGGALIVLDQLDPPQVIEPGAPGSLTDRLRNMRLQPGYQDYPWRTFQLFGLKPAGKSSDGKETYSTVALALVDPGYTYSTDAAMWASEFADRELALTRATLDSEQALRKVTQFKPQIAMQASVQAIMALALSWAMIIGYVWIRFGKASYGYAGVVALVHDVLIALAAIGLSGLVAGWAGFLLVENFRINMPVIAALLTIIGFSINDTIVIFDRVREVRGRLGVVTPDIINRAVNECMSRTILTTSTVLLTLFSMYIFGGSSIRGFNFCMLVGCLSGVYSTIAIASPLLLLSYHGKAVTARA